MVQHIDLRLLLLLIGKLGQSTEEKLMSIHAHYGGDMAIDLEAFKLESEQMEVPLAYQGANRSSPADVSRNSRCS